MGLWESVKALKLDSGDALIVGTTIGYLVAMKSGLLGPDLPIGDDIYWLKAITEVRTVPMLLLYGIGFFLKNSWILKVIGAILLYVMVYSLTFDIVTIKPYVVALKGIS